MDDQLCDLCGAELLEGEWEICDVCSWELDAQVGEDTGYSFDR